MWRDELNMELSRAEEGLRIGNTGLARTCARRAVGMAITEWQRRDARIRYGSDFLRQLRGVASDETMPEKVRQAATRLQERLGKDFQSGSKEPVGDARIVIDHVLTLMGESPGVS